MAALLAATDEIELTVDKLVAGGDGFGRFQGVPIFVARAAPGDRLRVRLSERHPDYGRAEIVEILSPGPGRREPPCPYFADCGGCDLQHLDDGAQLAAKVAAARETLLRLAHLEVPSEAPVVAGDPWAYRLRTQVHVEREAPQEAASEGDTDAPTAATGAAAEARLRVGYRGRRSHDLVAVDRCPVLAPELEERLAALPRELGDADVGGSLPRRIDLATDGSGRVTAAPPTVGLPGGELSIRVGEHLYSFDARCFFQGHRGLLERLVELAVGDWRGETAADLYSGVGLFTLPLAERYGRVVAVESDRIAARFARNNARRARAVHVETVAQAVETWVRALDRCDRVIVDPPRGGLAKPVVKALIRRPAARLTYVSCHAATLARDLAALAEVYACESFAFLDLFPQTGHLETVVQLTAR